MNFQELTTQYTFQHFKQVQMNRAELSASAFWSDNYQFVEIKSVGYGYGDQVSSRRRRFGIKDWHARLLMYLQ